MRLDGLIEKYICKKAFCALFGVGKSVVERIVSSLKSNIPSPIDKRGKHVTRTNKINERILLQIKTHISSFPKSVSHYSRHNNQNKQYLSPELCILKVYNMYLEKYESNVYEKLKRGEKVKPTVKYEFLLNTLIEILIYILVTQSLTQPNM